MAPGKDRLQTSLKILTSLTKISAFHNRPKEVKAKEANFPDKQVEQQLSEVANLRIRSQPCQWGWSHQQEREGEDNEIQIEQMGSEQ